MRKMNNQYLTLVEARETLEECRSQGIGVLGVERFLLIKGGIVPDIDGIADFSMAEGVFDSISGAVCFLDKYGGNDDERFQVELDD